MQSEISILKWQISVDGNEDDEDDGGGLCCVQRCNGAEIGRD